MLEPSLHWRRRTVLDISCRVRLSSFFWGFLAFSGRLQYFLHLILSGEKKFQQVVKAMQTFKPVDLSRRRDDEGGACVMLSSVGLMDEVGLVGAQTTSTTTSLD